MKKLNRVGEEYELKGGKLKIVEYFGNTNCTIQFEDGTIIKNVTYQCIKEGSVKNTNKPIVCGVGYFGQGVYNLQKNNSKVFRFYRIWNTMLDRCYDEKGWVNNPSYINCTVDESWHNFQVFAKWYEGNYREEFHLDKDILQKGNKIYSPDTCAFVPQEINALFTKCNKLRGIYPLGVYKDGILFKASIMKHGKKETIGRFKTPEEAFQAYKIVKEQHIKEMAEIWKDKITPEVYQALINYKVEITD